MSPCEYASYPIRSLLDRLSESAKSEEFSEPDLLKGGHISFLAID